MLFNKLTSEQYAAFKFETFDNTIPGVDYSYDYAKGFANNPKGWLGFLGNYGSGKTHLALSIAHQCLAIWPDLEIYYQSVTDLLYPTATKVDLIAKQTFFKNVETLKSAELVIFDDLDTRTHPRNWTNEMLYSLINERYIHRRPSVFTTSQDLDALDGRIHSRITDQSLSTLVLIASNIDYRKLRPEERRKTLNVTTQKEKANETENTK